MELVLPENVTNEDVEALWPLLLFWSASLAASLYLVFGARSFRILGAVMLGLVPVNPVAMWIWATNGGLEVLYPTTTSTIAGNVWIWSSFALIAGCVTAVCVAGSRLKQRRAAT